MFQRSSDPKLVVYIIAMNPMIRKHHQQKQIQENISAINSSFRRYQGVVNGIGGLGF